MSVVESALVEDELPLEATFEMVETLKEEELPPPQTTKKDSLRRRKKKSVAESSEVEKTETSPSKAKEAVKDKQTVEEKVTRTWLIFLAIPIFLLIAADLVLPGGGIQADLSPFVVWWDMIGTVTYYRSRSTVYDVRKMKPGRDSFIWTLYVVFISYMLYCGSGLISRTIVRKTPQIPSLAGVIEFTVQGFIPAHFFPYDYLFKLTADESNPYTRMQMLIVSFAWAISKIKSFVKFATEVVLVHNWEPVPALLICIFSCEAGSLISKVEINKVLHSGKAIERFPGGVKKFFGSTGLKASIVASAFMLGAVHTRENALVQMVFLYLSLIAIFYKYSNGLLEQVFDESVWNNAWVNERVSRLFSSKTSSKIWQQEAEKAGHDLVVFSKDVAFAAEHTGKLVLKDSKEAWAQSKLSDLTMDDIRNKVSEIKLEELEQIPSKLQLPNINLPEINLPEIKFEVPKWKRKQS